MTLNEYQEKANKYVVPTSVPEERVMGLLSEAGEVAGVFQKLLRKDYDIPDAMARLYKELGDVLWYISQIAKDNDWQLEDIAKDNIDKLESRYLRNQIQGEGDFR
jgi:NTP pyrophosphatase (non-canonical NTP hydrolase)